MKPRRSGLVLRNEWRLLYGILRPEAACLAVLLLTLAFARASGFQRQAAEVRQHDLLASADASRLQDAASHTQALVEGNGSVSRFRDPRNADVVGRRLATQHALLSQPAVAALAVGQMDLQLSWHPVSLEPRDALLATGSLHNPRSLAVGQFDANFVVVFIAPLLLLVLLTASPAWERDQAVLRLLAAQGTALGRWLLLLILLPAMVNVAVELTHPQPSRITYVDAVRKPLVWPAPKAAMLLAQYLEDHPELAGLMAVFSSTAISGNSRSRKSTFSSPDVARACPHER